MANFALMSAGRPSEFGVGRVTRSLDALATPLPDAIGPSSSASESKSEASPKGQLVSRLGKQTKSADGPG